MLTLKKSLESLFSAKYFCITSLNALDFKISANVFSELLSNNNLNCISGV